jgi:DNA-binding Lrp family transcriptional regulator
MSRETRIPVSTIFDKIRTYKETGLIRKNTAIVSFERFGYNTKALIFFSAQREDKSKLAQILQNNPNVNSLLKINSGWDLMAEVIFPNYKEIEDFLETIEEQVTLKDKKVFYIIDELKKEEFLSNPARVEADLQPR